MSPSSAGAGDCSYSDCIGTALQHAMDVDDSIVVLGCGVTDYSGIFGTCLPARAQYEDRFIETPLSENMLTGACVGMALGGLRPVLIHARMDFLPLTMEHIGNSMAKWGFQTGHYPNVVIRSIVGRGWGQGPTHSQNLSNMLSLLPGLRVYMPYRPVDAYFALRHALMIDGPTVIVEPRRLYVTKAEPPWRNGIPTGIYWGLGNIYAEHIAADLMIVAFGDALLDAIAAARILTDGGIHAWVYDPQCIPMPAQTIIDGVERAHGRLAVVDNGWGLADHVVSICAQANVLSCPPVVITPDFSPTPASAHLESEYYVSAERIIHGVERLGLRPAVVSTPAPAGYVRDGRNQPF